MGRFLGIVELKIKYYLYMFVIVILNGCIVMFIMNYFVV